MKKVKENKELCDLLSSNEFMFMDEWFYISSEEDDKSYNFVTAFLNLELDLKPFKKLNEEEVLFKINTSFCIIKGAVNILLIAT